MTFGAQLVSDAGGRFAGLLSAQPLDGIGGL